jgi:hypothetical protein
MTSPAVPALVRPLLAWVRSILAATAVVRAGFAIPGILFTLAV